MAVYGTSNKVLAGLLLVLCCTTAQIVFPGEDQLRKDNQPKHGARPSGSEPGTNTQPRNTGVQDHGSAILFPRAYILPEVPCVTAHGTGGLCRLLVQCATFFAEIAVLARSPCTINAQQQGVCCPKVAHPTMDTNTIVDKPRQPVVAAPDIQHRQINFACEQSQQQQQQQQSFERELVFNNIVAPIGSPVFLHARFFETNAIVFQQGQQAAVALQATLNMVQEHGLSKLDAEFGLSQFDIKDTIIGSSCPPEPACLQTKYRSADGSCNNLKHTKWGQAQTAYERIIPPDYEDGVGVPRLSKRGGQLPSARVLSQHLTADHNSDYESFTLLIMQWGQFLDHDITFTPISKGDNRADISCCSAGQVRPPSQRHPACFPIPIPANDVFYGPHGQQCMEFIRSMPAMRRDCKFGPREQMNQITAFIDSSTVYGSDTERQRSLRELRGGRMRVTRVEGRELLPGDDRALGCGGRGPLPCFKAGDARVNEQPALAVIHTLWMRQHNKVAGELARLNPGWVDETLFQEARRIINAQMQHITFNEYLPIVLGSKFMVSFGLVPLSSGHANTYRESADPTINNAFAAAAFRYGHTLVAKTIEGYNRFGAVDRSVTVSQAAFAPFFLYERGAIDSMLRGLSIQPSQKFDNFFTDELTNKLFARNGSFGLDLVALNIQRGRDHGLPGYNAWRKTCHLPKAHTFSDFEDVMAPQAVLALSQLYAHPDDVDLFIGGLFEHPKVGSLLGHTFLCIVGDQFARLKLGDRFYYENGGHLSSFTPTQLNEIRKTSLARIMCDNSDEIEQLQPLVFMRANVVNRRVSCHDEHTLPRVSLDPWRNEPVWQ